MKLCTDGFCFSLNVGLLFQDRYYSELIKSDEQMLSTSRYIHLNPLRAKMVERPQEYK